MKNRTTKTPNAVQQWVNLSKAFPGATGGVRKNRLRCRLDLQPTELCQVYTTSLEYSLEMSPKVFVVHPELERRGDELPEHLYSDGSLCLYLPNSGEWSPNLYLSETIVPWTSEWLLHYELWLATGEWHGGGMHPGETTPLHKDANRGHDRQGRPWQRKAR